MIIVFCDNPSHARGKKATVAVFDRQDSGAWGDRRERTRPRWPRADSPAAFKCKLCRRELPVWAEERRVLFAVLNLLAAHGVSRIRLSALVAVASEIEKGGSGLASFLPIPHGASGRGTTSEGR